MLQINEQNNTTPTQSPVIFNPYSQSPTFNMSPIDWDKGIKSFSAASSNQARKQVSKMKNEVMKTPEVEPTQPKKDQRQEISDALSGILSEEETAYDLFQNTLAELEKGSVNLSRDEKKLLGNLQERYDILKRRQMVANQSLVGGTQTALQASGMARYSSELAELELNRVQNEGIERLREIEVDLDEKLSEARQAIIDGRVESIRESYKGYTDRLKERRDTLNTLRLNLNDYESFLNSQKTSDIKEYEFAVSQGYSGTFQDWVKSGKKGSGGGASGKVLTILDVDRLKTLYPEFSDQIQYGMTDLEVQEIIQGGGEEEEAVVGSTVRSLQEIFPTTSRREFRTWAKNLGLSKRNFSRQDEIDALNEKVKEYQSRGLDPEQEIKREILLKELTS